MRYFLLISSFLSLSACASLNHGVRQDIVVLTPEAEDANCIVSDKLYKYRVNGGDHVSIQRSGKPLTVRCTALGNREKTVTITPKIDSALYANVTNGIILGTLYDLETKAAYAYPDTIVVSFADVPFGIKDQPYYTTARPQMPDGSTGVEDFNTGQVVMTKDKYNYKRPLVKIRGQESVSDAADISAAEVGTTKPIAQPNPEKTNQVDAPYAN
jgi:hypothetical protein